VQRRVRQKSAELAAVAADRITKHFLCLVKQYDGAGRGQKKRLLVRAYMAHAADGADIRKHHGKGLLIALL